jgi:hypothetical protein
MQMTKTDFLAGAVRRHDISDLDLAVSHDDPVNEQFHQQTSLLKIGPLQPLLNPLTEILDGPG